MHVKKFKWFTLFCHGLLGFLCLSCEKHEATFKSGESLYRLDQEAFFTLTEPRPLPLPTYPWEERFSGKHPKITKEFFRCRGSSLNPVRIDKKAGKAPLYFHDCLGHTSHGLPLREEKEFIYPALIEILNFIQEETGKKVVVTTGHRCPLHNMYCDSSPSNWGSKHMLGAEVDFYVQGMEEKPDKIIQLIMDYYTKVSPFQGDLAFEKFERYARGGKGVSELPWYNREIFIKLYKADEGRDSDNQHCYPYVCIQLRQDRDTLEQTTYTHEAAQNFRRY